MVRCRSNAFTLTEVLIAIAILFLLVGLGLSALNQSRQKAQQSACMSNLRQLGLGIAAYVQDNDDRLPSMSGWSDWKKQHPQQKGCPQVQPTERLEVEVQGVPGYAFNAGLSKGGGVRNTEVIHPATTVYCCEEAPSVTFTISPDPFQFLSPYPYGQDEGWKRHDGGGNYLFGDGHVKWYTPDGVDGCNSVVGNTGVKPTFCHRGPHPFGSAQTAL